MQSAPPTTTLTAPTTSDQTTDATTVPTIAYDDSAAAEFWEPVPEGMTPAEFQPDVLTREEVTKYVELPNPNPDDWNIPEEGITPEYIERVYQYLLNLYSGLIRAGVAAGVDDSRVRDSTSALYRHTGGAENFQQALDSAAEMTERDQGEWIRFTNLKVIELRHRTDSRNEFPCVFARVEFDQVGDRSTDHKDQWVRLVLNSPPNWLNPTGWREDALTPADTDDLSRFSCDLWDLGQ